MIRYFRLSAATYEAVRSGLDAHYGHPNAVADSCLPPAADWPAIAGDICIAVAAAILARPEVAAQLSTLNAGGLVTEITAAEFLSLQPNQTP